MKQYNNGTHSFTKLTPIKAYLKKKEGFNYKKLLDKRKRKNPKFKIHDFVRTADIKKNFSKKNTTNFSLKI